MPKKIPQKPTHRKRSPFYWWRRFPTHQALHHYKPLLERIQNGDFDYVMDCIDSVSPKLYLIKTCYELKQRFISSMGAGGKTDASKVHVADISKTYNCPFARTVRKRLKTHRIRKGFKVVFNSSDLNKDSLKLTDGSNFKKSFYGTISYMPALFGLRMASEVIQDLIDS